MKYLLEVSYDGTNYKGFQLQPRPTNTVQLVLERALCRFLHTDRVFLALQASSRTDTGVHSRQQYCTFFSPRPLSESKLVHCVNALLPEDVAVHSLKLVPREFNVRFTYGKIYTYDVHTSSQKDCFLGRYRKAHATKDPLDVDRMRSACDLFVGDNDFRLLSEWSDRSGRSESEASTVRRVFAVQVLPIDGGLRIVIFGKGFLHKQCRNMAGVLLAVGSYHLAPSDVTLLLRPGLPSDLARPLKTQFKVAEGRGLTLQRVFLDENDLPEPSDDLHAYLL